jgi:hypothetical protein
MTVRVRRKTPTARKRSEEPVGKFDKKKKKKKARNDGASSQIKGVIDNYSTTNLHVISSLSIELIKPKDAYYI